MINTNENQIGTNDIFDLYLQDLVYKTYSNIQFKNSLLILQKLLQNIINKPEEPKYRSISKTNKTLQESIFQYNQVNEMLLAIGFEETEESFKLNQELSKEQFSYFRIKERYLNSTIASLNVHSDPDPKMIESMKQQEANHLKEQLERQKILDDFEKNRKEKNIEFSEKLKRQQNKKQ